MTKETTIKIFEQKQIRTSWNEDEEKWYFSIIDVIEVLTGTDRPRKYWNDLKTKLNNEGSELSEKIGQLKMTAEDGKMRITDVADTEQLFRLIQSIPSPKAEPFKMWIAKVARERIDEIEDPEIGIDRLLETYLRKGYSKEWINQRLESIEIRKELTDEWEKRGVEKGQEFAILTNDITQAWSGFTTKEYKKHKDLKKENLRDNMTNLELVLNSWQKLPQQKYRKKRNRKHLPKTEKLPDKAAQLQEIPVKKLSKKQVKMSYQILMPSNWNKKSKTIP